MNRHHLFDLPTLNAIINKLMKKDLCNNILSIFTMAINTKCEEIIMLLFVPYSKTSWY